MVVNGTSGMAQFIWGENYREGYVDLFLNARKPGALNSDQAREVLDAIVHPEGRKILETLEVQMNRGDTLAAYTEPSASQHTEYLANDGSKRLFFSDDFYRYGLIGNFARLITTAHPNYKFVRSPIGSMNFQKKD